MKHTTDNNACISVNLDPFTGPQLDVTSPEVVEITINRDRRVWINVNGICVCRICNPGKLTLTTDH